MADLFVCYIIMMDGRSHSVRFLGFMHRGCDFGMCRNTEILNLLLFVLGGSVAFLCGFMLAEVVWLDGS